MRREYAIPVLILALALFTSPAAAQPSGGCKALPDPKPMDMFDHMKVVA